MKSTKELAWELGLLRKRSHKSKEGHGLRRAKQTNQMFAYLIVIDYEATCWQDQKYRQHEIIEFPAVLLNTSTGNIEDEFHYYVQPMENPILSDFCKQFTGISQEQVDDGVTISQCLQYFKTWLHKIAKEHNVIYNQFEDGKKSCTFVTWSDWDFGVCLQYECRRKQLRKPPELDTWIDLRATYKKFYSRKPQGLNGALKDVGISFEGREHSGLHDAINTAKLAWRMMSDGCMMQITKNGAHGKINEHIQKMKKFVATRTCAESRIERSHNPNQENRNTISVSPLTGQKYLNSIEHLETKKRPCPNEEDEDSGKGKVQKISHHKQETNHLQQFTSSTSVFKTPEIPVCKFQKETISQTRTHTNYNFCQQGFSNKMPLTGSSLPFSNQNNSSVGRNRSMSTPGNSFSFIGSNSLMKRTPPMCGCGRRAQRKIVQSPGPNQGRIFFCCPNGRKKTVGCFGIKSGQAGCGYFKWEQPSPSGSSSAQKDASRTTASWSSVHSLPPSMPQPNFNTPTSSVSSSEKQKKKTLGLLRLSQSSKS